MCGLPPVAGKDLDGGEHGDSARGGRRSGDAAPSSSLSIGSKKSVRAGGSDFPRRRTGVAETTAGATMSRSRSAMAARTPSRAGGSGGNTSCGACNCACTASICCRYRSTSGDARGTGAWTTRVALRAKCSVFVVSSPASGATVQTSVTRPDSAGRRSRVSLESRYGTYP